MINLFNLKRSKTASVYKNNVFVANVGYKTNKELNEKLRVIMNSWGTGFYTTKEIK